MPRNASGNYTLPAGNPVVTNTTIDTGWANGTMSDLAGEVTNSLDRNGRGGMLAALKLVDGAVGAPALTFNNEPTSGVWRSGAGIINWSLLGVETMRLIAQGLAVPLGIVGAPGLTFMGDPNTGWWSPGADIQAWSINGAELLRLSSTGLRVLSGGMTVDTGGLLISAGGLAVTAGGMALTAGVYQAPLGAVGAPSYTFSGDTNNGWWSPAADVQAWSVAGVEIMRLLNTGLRLVKDDALLEFYNSAGAVRSGYLQMNSAAAAQLRVVANQALGFYTNDTLRAQITAGGVFQDAAGLEFGYRRLVTVGNTATAAATEVGKAYLNTGNITVNNGVFSAGDWFSVYNNSGAAITVTQGTVTTMRLGGTASTGSRTIAPRGMATVFFPTATECVVSGAGVS